MRVQFSPESRPKRGHSHGFTLAEILVVLAIIGIIASITVAALGSYNETASRSRDRRNAQSVVMLYTTACAAGATFSSQAGDVSGLVGELVDGKSGAGNMADSFFKMSPIPEPEKTMMMRYLAYDAGTGMLRLTGSEP